MNDFAVKLTPTCYNPFHDFTQRNKVLFSSVQLPGRGYFKEGRMRVRASQRSAALQEQERKAAAALGGTCPRGQPLRHHEDLDLGKTKPPTHTHDMRRENEHITASWDTTYLHYATEQMLNNADLSRAVVTQ